MPLANTKSQHVLQEYHVFLGEELPKSHSYVDWMAKRGVTQTSIAAESNNTTVMTFTTESTNDGVWAGEVQFPATGEANLILTLTAGGLIKKTVFKYIVKDPDRL